MGDVGCWILHTKLDATAAASGILPARRVCTVDGVIGSSKDESFSVLYRRVQKHALDRDGHEEEMAVDGFDAIWPAAASYLPALCGMNFFETFIWWSSDTVLSW